MGKLKDILADLCRVDGVQAAVVVSQDGFVIEGVTNSGEIDYDALGAIVSTGVGASRAMGGELQLGSLTQILAEYAGGLLTLNALSGSVTLAVVTTASANVGSVRYQTRKRVPELEAAL